MSGIQKDIFDLKQRVFYIDRSVNVYFNKEITKLNLVVSSLLHRIAALEKGERVEAQKVEVNNDLPKNDTLPVNKSKKKKNNIRNISLN